MNYPRTIGYLAITIFIIQVLPFSAAVTTAFVGLLCGILITLAFTMTAQIRAVNAPKQKPATHQSAPAASSTAPAAPVESAPVDMAPAAPAETTPDHTHVSIPVTPEFDAVIPVTDDESTEATPDTN